MAWGFREVFNKRVPLRIGRKGIDRGRVDAFCDVLVSAHVTIRIGNVFKLTHLLLFKGWFALNNSVSADNYCLSGHIFSAGSSSVMTFKLPLLTTLWHKGYETRLRLKLQMLNRV